MSHKLLTCACLTGAVGMVYCAIKVKEACRILNCSVTEIADTANIDISDEIIKTAVETAVNREVKYAVPKAVNKAIGDIEKDISEETKTAVYSEYSSIKEKVAEKIAVQVENMDISDLRKTVMENAEKRISEKFDDDLDAVLNKFNHELDNVGKIYKSIADSMTKTKEVNYYGKL